MTRNILAVLSLTVGALQAWDSGALGAEPLAQAMILLAVLLPPAAIAVGRGIAARGAAVLAAAALLVAARMISAVHLPELALAAVFSGILVFIDYVQPRQTGGRSRPSPPR